jgi:hypothetical protein
MFSCALNNKPNTDGSRLSEDHVSLRSKYTEGNTIKEIKQGTNCHDDSCILKTTEMPAEEKEKIKREALKAPTGSNDHNYWLNNTEIDTVMSQFRKKYPGFAHGFIHMIDLHAFAPSNVKSFDYPVFPTTETDFANEFRSLLIKRGLLSCTMTYTLKLSI